MPHPEQCLCCAYISQQQYPSVLIEKIKYWQSSGKSHNNSSNRSNYTEALTEVAAATTGVATATIPSVTAEATTAVAKNNINKI